jgi:uncharacterized protein (DUF305 family)
MKRALVAPLLVVILSGCSTQSAQPSRTAAPADTAIISTPSTSSSPEFTSTDSGWIQLVTPMDEQAEQLLSLATHHHSAPALTSWAADLAKEHRTELTQLRRLLHRMGLSDTNVHEGHDMPGMVTNADLEGAHRLTGTDFDRFVVREIRAHLEQSQRVSRSESQAGGSREARRLASRIADSRSGQLKTLSSLGR